jgi:Mn2+/Fe2+ NRAMP family transporter
MKARLPSRNWPTPSAGSKGWTKSWSGHARSTPSFFCPLLWRSLSISRKVNRVKALYWTAIINGLLAPFLLVGILIVASDHVIMRNQPSSLLGRVTVGITTVAMFAAGVAMFAL